MPNDYFKIETGGATDTGCVRDHNEDSFVVRPDQGIWVVADGMGGHDAGDYASQTITGEMASVGFSISTTDLQARFMERLGRAHHQIRAHAESLGGGTVGATLVGLLIFEAEFSCIWSGDSRIYRMRDGLLEQLTNDHTEVRELLEAGMITPEEAETWPRKNVITRAIGVSEDPNCDMVTGNVRAGDVFLLCSDGLTEHNSDADLQALLHAATTPQEACDMLIAQTLERGAKDNTTAVVVTVAPSDVDIWT
ncbi:MAG: protein phosphatase 2C domain-containing protein [Yoonia sp.]|uniref:PP2C family protein-serine/threonine phosphatase n=1 Tax=Rhodobacterales TaxID=204455 RepID=UPI001FF35D67|nr:protein phosphatase 2C domain-containing protein [Loktanella sp. F6476L]MCK0122319.1 protein phosphatase 2C domain-containing protein [Loktanella sp. F6476L]